MMSLRMALRSIGSNKLRAALTMLGIVIGVVALVVLVSLVSGATNSVTDAVAALGSDMLTVTIRDDKGSPVTLTDIDTWADENEAVGYTAAYSSGSATGKYGAKNESFTVYGVTPSYFTIEGKELEMGRFIKSSDVAGNTRVCVINSTTASDLIGYSDCIGEEISLNGMKFTIVGVLEKDESLVSTFLGGNYNAFVPYTTMLRLSSTLNGNVTSFVASAAEGHTMDEAKEFFDTVLYKRFEEDEDAYSINSMDVMEDAMGDITSVLSILLGGIAGISLVVGGIGIMNIMLVTVTERTREIGIRKAIGATRGTILRQFLMEAVVLCMMGCAIGIFISWSIIRLIGVIVASLDLSFALNGKVVLLSVLFCFFIGVVFGLYPANKAAKMKPIDALHYGG